MKKMTTHNYDNYNSVYAQVKDALGDYWRDFDIEEIIDRTYEFDGTCYLDKCHDEVEFWQIVEKCEDQLATSTRMALQTGHKIFVAQLLPGSRVCWEWRDLGEMRDCALDFHEDCIRALLEDPAGGYRAAEIELTGETLVKEFYKSVEDFEADEMAFA